MKGELRTSVTEEIDAAYRRLGAAAEHDTRLGLLFLMDPVRALIDAGGELGRAARKSLRRVGSRLQCRAPAAHLPQAMLHDPRVLILDEPTNGLDPQQIVEIRALLRERATERAILFSTHILQEIAAICTRIMVIHDGHKIADDRPEVLLGHGDLDLHDRLQSQR